MQSKTELETSPHTKAPESEVLAVLADVRKYVHNLAVQEHDADLMAINVTELSEEDIVLLRRFMLGELTLDAIERQEKLLINLQEARSSLRLLAYMKKKLTNHK